MEVGCIKVLHICLNAHLDFFPNLFADDLEIARYVQTRFGSTQLYKDGYVYKRNSKSQDTVYWACRNARVGCPARAGTKGQILVFCRGQHNHPPNIRVENETILD